MTENKVLNIYPQFPLLFIEDGDVSDKSPLSNFDREPRNNDM